MELHKIRNRTDTISDTGMLSQRTLPHGRQTFVDRFLQPTTVHTSSSIAEILGETDGGRSRSMEKPRSGLFHRASKSRKNGDPRTLPLNAVAVEALERLRGRGKPRGTEPVFPSARTGDALPGSRGGFSTALEEAKVAGYSWHCNRHTFASRLVMAGVDLRTVAELLGHRTLQMVMRYSHLAPEHQVSAVDRLVDVGNERDTKSDTGASGAESERRK